MEMYGKASLNLSSRGCEVTAKLLGIYRPICSSEVRALAERDLGVRRPGSGGCEGQAEYGQDCDYGGNSETHTV